MTTIVQADMQEDFRQAMRRLATTVAIVTAGTGDSVTGMAATAVMSVAADPPTIVVGVNRDASLSPILTREARFCVNLLAERHRDLVGIFSGQKKGAARFETGGWIYGEGEPPVLADAVASLICETRSTMEVATHTLFVGEVRTIINHPTIDPLIWVGGAFAVARR